ncbi:MAG: Fic/DOC family N-terminal domain-containing protein [Bacteroidia bacterium]
MLYKFNNDRLKPWNELPLLPINEQLYQNIEIYDQLGKAKAALGKLQGRSIAIPNQGLLINSISLQEAKISSAIENIFTTDDELYKAYSEESAHTEQQSGPSKEILKAREALWSGYNYLKNKSGFNRDYFIHIFQQIKQTKDEIRLPFVETVIRQGGSGENAGQVSYTPPRGENIIENKLDNLIEFVNDDARYQIDPLLKMAIAHFQFEAIHPFRDGNGRTGRIFNIHYLTQKNLLDLPILFLSRYIMDNKENYYSGLMGVSQRGDWKTWLLYMLRAVESTSNITYQKINDILSSKESMLTYIKTKNKKIRKPEQLVDMLFTQPYIKVKHLTDGKIYAEGTARDYLNLLAEMRVVEKKTIEGRHYYLNQELFRILSE